jgi:hypothetical protein
MVGPAKMKTPAAAAHANIITIFTFDLRFLLSLANEPEFLTFVPTKMVDNTYLSELRGHDGVVILTTNEFLEERAMGFGRWYPATNYYFAGDFHAPLTTGSAEEETTNMLPTVRLMSATRHPKRRERQRRPSR